FQTARLINGKSHHGLLCESGCARSCCSWRLTVNRDLLKNGVRMVTRLALSDRRCGSPGRVRVVGRDTTGGCTSEPGTCAVGRVARLRTGAIVSTYSASNVQLSCGGNVGRTEGAHANEPKGSSVEPNPLGFICSGFATFERTIMPDAQRLIPGISATKD